MAQGNGEGKECRKGASKSGAALAVLDGGRLLGLLQPGDVFSMEIGGTRLDEPGGGRRGSTPVRRPPRCSRRSVPLPQTAAVLSAAPRCMIDDDDG